jgi:hypothetical protein
MHCVGHFETVAILTKGGRVRDPRKEEVDDERQEGQRSQNAETAKGD